MDGEKARIVCLLSLPEECKLVDGRSPGFRIDLPLRLPGLSASGTMQRSSLVTVTGSRRTLTGFPQPRPSGLPRLESRTPSTCMWGRP